MELKWPWKQFPRDDIAWDECRRQMENAVWKLKSSLFLGTFTNVSGFKKQVIEFLKMVEEPLKIQETITISEFKNLVAADSSDKIEAFGLFALSGEIHRKQCKNLKVGDKVFYLKTKDNGIVHRVPQVDVIIQGAVVIN